MATHTVPGEQVSVEALSANRRALAWGLFWGALMLGLLLWWLANRDDLDYSFLILGAVALLGVASLVGGLKGILRRPDSGAPEQVQPLLLKERRVTGFALLAGATVLLLLGLGVGIQLGKSGFGEAATIVVLALIAAGAGVSQLLPPGAARREQLLQRVGPLLGSIAFVVAVFAIVAVVVLWRAFSLRAVPFEPEVVGTVIFGMIALAAWVWYNGVAPSSGRTPAQNARLLVLIVGGGLGLIIALTMIWRVARDWDTIFPGNTPMAQSENIYLLWLYLYIELLGLVILFGSLLLARADIRESAFMRRLLYGYNAVLTGVLLLVTLVILNVVVYVTYPLTFEWSKARGLHSLSSSSKNLLQSLRDPVRVYVLMSPGEGFVYAETQSLLDNVTAYTRQVQVEYVSPDRDPKRYTQLARQYEQVRQEATQLRDGRFIEGADEPGRGVLLVYNPDAAKSRHAFISSTELRSRPDPHGGEPPGQAYRGEDAIMTQLRILKEQEEGKPKIYFTQGSDELNIKDSTVHATRELLRRGLLDRPGAGLLVDRLKKDNYDVRGLLWTAPPGKKEAESEVMVYAKKSEKDKQPEVPDDAKVVIIAHPGEPLPKEALEALERYLDRGGKMVVLTNLPVSVSRKGEFFVPETGLEALLKKYNVELGRGYLVRYPENFREYDPTELLAVPPANTRNKVALSFSGKHFPVGGILLGGSGPARSVKPVATPGMHQVDPILQVQESVNGPFWSEPDLNTVLTPDGRPVPGRLVNYLQNLNRQGLLDSRKSPEPLPVAVAVSDRDGRPRMVVFGDARFASNLSIRSRTPYYDFLVSSVEWLAERPGNIGIRPKVTTFYELPTKEMNRQRLIWLPLGLTMLTLIGLGLGIWVVRRR
ncbi:MAG: GldG family protein [Gemmataceae bacterium]|nr:GldG family protein [Gemmataceae bacterium]